MSINDERVRFYLRNRERIEEWAALRKQATAAVDGWLTDLHPAVTELAAGLGAQLNPRIDPDNEWPTFQLVRPSWPLHVSGEPIACVALQWHRGYVTLGSGEPPYVGVYCRSAEALGAQLRASEAVKTARQALNHKMTTLWLAYGYVLPGPEVPESFDAYRDSLMTELARAWRTYAPLIDAAIAPPT